MGKPTRKLSAYNLHMKRELKGKMKGKTKAQRKAIFKAAARSWKSKSKGKPKARSKPKSGGSSRSSSTTGGRKLGKNTFNTNKLFSLIRKAALIAPAAGVILDPALSPQEKARVGLQKYTGVDMRTGQFHLNSLREGYEPWFWTSLATYGIPKVITFVKGLIS